MLRRIYACADHVACANCKPAKPFEPFSCALRRHGREADGGHIALVLPDVCGTTASIRASGRHAVVDRRPESARAGPERGVRESCSGSTVGISTRIGGAGLAVCGGAGRQWFCRFRGATRNDSFAAKRPAAILDPAAVRERAADRGRPAKHQTPAVRHAGGGVPVC